LSKKVLLKLQKSWVKSSYFENKNQGVLEI